MKRKSGVSRNVIKGVVGEFLRCRLEMLPGWARQHRLELATELRIPPADLAALTISEVDPYTSDILFNIDDIPFEIIVRTKRTKSSEDRATLEPTNGSRQAVLRRVLYGFLEYYLEITPVWLRSEPNRNHVAQILRTPPDLLFTLADANCVSKPYTQPLIVNWLEYRIELIARTKAS